MLTYTEVLNNIINKLASNDNIIPTRHQEVIKSILDFSRDQWLIGDIKEIDCTDDYIRDNFDQNGAGIGERAGWHICNGLNNTNTRNRTGRVSVGYGTVQPYDPGNAKSFPSVGNVIGGPVVSGSRNAVVVNHTHNYTTYASFNGANGTNRTKAGVRTFFPQAGQTDPVTADANVGVSGTDKNMQPYIVTLFIQKVSNP
jgi:hypothetical protein